MRVAQRDLPQNFSSYIVVGIQKGEHSNNKVATGNE